MERRTAGIVGKVSIGLVMLVWFGVLLALLYVPRLLAVWTEGGVELSTAQKLLVWWSQMLSRTWWAFSPPLLILTAALIAWRIIPVRRGGKAPPSAHPSLDIQGQNPIRRNTDRSAEVDR